MRDINRELSKRRKNIMKIGTRVLFALITLILCACSDDFSSGYIKRNVKTYKVAVVMPKDRQEA